MGRFLLGVIVELLQLILVVTAALFAVETASGNSVALGLLVAYGLLVWWPARDLVEGWLGLVSRRLPGRYESRAENIGRGIAGIAFAVFWGVLWLVLGPSHKHGQPKAFERTYALFALAIFGIGGAVPRLWFGVRSTVWGQPSQVPELLQRAGRRGAVFILAMFVGIGLGFVAGYAAPAQQPRPVDEHLLTFDERWGSLCRVATKDCPSSRRVVAERVQEAHPAAVHVSVNDDGDPPLCRVSAAWSGDTFEQERTVDAPRAAPIAFHISLPEGVDHCSYFLDVAEGSR